MCYGQVCTKALDFMFGVQVKMTSCKKKKTKPNAEKIPPDI